MPIFLYKGYAADGSRVKGQVEAEGPKDAVIKVKALGHFPNEIAEKPSQRKGYSSKGEAAQHFTRRLALLLSSGVPLVESMRALSEESRGAWKDTLIAIRERVVGGSSLSRALEGYPEIFPEYYTSMISAGEQSGTLDSVLMRIADFLEADSRTRSKVMTALLYPAFMACVSLIVLFFLFIFVVPKITRIFDDTKHALPFATLILIWISHAVTNYWWLLLGVLAAGVTGGRAYAKKKHEAIHKIFLSLFEGIYLARFARTLSFLLEGGLPMLRSLELAGKSSGNLYLLGMARRAAVTISEGASLSHSLAGLPPVFLELLSTGEKTGRIAEVLRRAADGYESEFEKSTERFLALLEPTMILVMGLVVGFIVFAVLLPMFQLNQLIK